MTSRWTRAVIGPCLLAASLATAQEPAADPVVIDLWPADHFPASPVNGPERVGREGSATGAVSNISRPRMVIHRPARPNGTAVVIAGGGGYFRIQVGSGSEPVARWLASTGVTAAVLYYRLPADGWASTAPIEDGQRAIRLLRANAGELGIDPAQIGILGMSAGGHMAAVTATRHATDFYPAVDAADGVSARPDFAVLLYPVVSMRPPLDTTRTRQHMDRAADVETAFSPELHVDADTAPMFLAHCKDDAIADADHSRVMYAALQAAGIPAALHLFERCGHSWGLGRPGTDAAAWPLLFSRWARGLGFMPRVARGAVQKPAQNPIQNPVGNEP